MSDIIPLRKMQHRQDDEGGLIYSLGDLRPNDWLGRELRIRFDGEIHCVHCDARIKKTFGDGYCYPCFSSLARCDACIIKPETCHFHQGTCREPDWGQAHCFVPHVVYLARTSGLKVGVTGAHKVMERWGDQGARAACVLARCPDRLHAGKLESALARHFDDRTRWQALIGGRSEAVDFQAARAQARSRCPKELAACLVEDEPVLHIRYPVESFVDKARSLRLDKQPLIEGRLRGIVGQYLLFAEGGFNLRRHSGYLVEIQVD